MIWLFETNIWHLILAVVLSGAICFKSTTDVLSKRSVAITAAALWVIATIIVPYKNLLLGDALNILKFNWEVIPTEPLTSLLYMTLGKGLGLGDAAFRVVAVACGIGLIFALRYFLRLFESETARVVTVLAILASATVQFYFGYVEFYVLRHLLTLLFTVVVIVQIKENRQSFLPAALLLVAIFSHLSAICLIPAILYFYRSNRTIAMAMLVIAVAGAAVVVFTTNTEALLVPLAPTSINSYTMFSAEHLLDFLNSILLVAPAFFLALISTRSWGEDSRFLLLAVIGGVLFSFVVDPKLGAFRDWDLLSIYAVPAAVLVALRAPKQRWAAAVLIAVICLRILPWIEFNAQLQANEVKQILNRETHYSCGYIDGYRNYRWGFHLYEVGDLAGAEAAWLRRLECKPDAQRSRRLLAILYKEQGNYREAIQQFQLLMQQNPQRAEYRYYAAMTSFIAGNFQDAANLVKGGDATFMQSRETALLSAALLSVSGRDQEACQLASRISDLSPLDEAVRDQLLHSAHLVGYTQLVSRLQRATIISGGSGIDTPVEADSRDN